MDKIIEAFRLTWDLVVDIFFKIKDSLDIFWKGMLAIFLALGIIMVVTMLLNFIINKIETKKKSKQ